MRKKKLLLGVDYSFLLAAHMATALLLPITQMLTK